MIILYQAIFNDAGYGAGFQSMTKSDKAADDPLVTPVGLLALLCFIVLAHNQHKIKKARLEHPDENSSMVSGRALLAIYIVISLAMLWNFLATKFGIHFDVNELMLIVDMITFALAPLATIFSSPKMLVYAKRLFGFY